MEPARVSNGSAAAPDEASGARLMVTEEPASRASGPLAENFVLDVCLPFLHSAQNPDGGWGFHPGAQSRVEPTCWALQALGNSAPAELRGEVHGRGFQFLRKAQLADGSWPASPEESTGSFVTALACWALLGDHDSRNAVAAGLRWLVQDRPRASGFWRRCLGRIMNWQRVSRQNDSYLGWGWTPNTASWVEPTAIAAIVLELSPPELLPAGANQRRQSAEDVLYDRMCPGGGWNCGNPLVYGVAGQPLAMPTAWALLALRKHRQRAENLLSLDWLEKSVAEERGPGSLALARICLESYGRSWPEAAPSPENLYGNHQFMQSVPVTAWVCLAANPNRQWLLGESREAR